MVLETVGKAFNSCLVLSQSDIIIKQNASLWNRKFW